MAWHVCFLAWCAGRPEIVSMAVLAVVTCLVLADIWSYRSGLGVRAGYTSSLLLVPGLIAWVVARGGETVHAWAFGSILIEVVCWVAWRPYYTRKRVGHEDAAAGAHDDTRHPRRRRPRRGHGRP
jgi:hypothetical protein